MTTFTPSSQTTDNSTPSTSSPCNRLVQWLSTCLPCMRPADNCLFDYHKLSGKEQISQLNRDGEKTTGHVEL